MKKSWLLILISLQVIVISFVVVFIFKDKRVNVVHKETGKLDNLVHISKSETKNEVIYEVEDNQNHLTYSWTFNKDEGLLSSLKDRLELDLNLKLNILNDLEDENLNKLITNNDKLIIAFDHHGELPTKAKVKIDVKDKYEDGEQLYLYYLNEDMKQVEYIDNGIPVKNGYAQFEISHCSNYFLTASIVQDAVNNPKNINLIIIIMVVVVIVLIGATLFQNKK